MNLFLEILVVNFFVLYYYLEALVLLFIPARYRSKKITGQVVLVTGAGSGIGRLLSLRFARHRCKLVLWDLNAESNEETASQVRQLGATAHTYTCNVSNRANVYQVANKVKSEVGNVDILVNNAGIVTGAKLLDCSDEKIEKTMAVNCTAHFWTTKAFLPAMLAQNRGHIVTIASTAGLFGVNGLVDYCTSKFAAVGFDETLRAELHAQGKTGVHTTCVCPIYISTGMFEGAKTRFASLMPLLEPDYAADKILEAVLTNQAVLCIPRFIYFMLALKNLMPVKTMNLSNDFFGINVAQSEFRGRLKRD